MKPLGAGYEVGIGLEIRGRREAFPPTDSSGAWTRRTRAIYHNSCIDWIQKYLNSL
jgi:hypothetical protein